jgi:peptidoglycan/LPS O-acetylase OafA/YrhL
MGVDLFFVLSGFLITGILWDARGGTAYFRRFYARRTRRIFPLYYLVLAAALFVVPHLPLSAAHAAKAAGVEGRQWWYWLYLSNFEMAGAGRIPHAVLGVSWTLAIEEQFYLVWPVVVLLLNRRALMRLCAALVFVAPAIRIVMALGGSPYLPMYVLTWCRMDALAAGAWVALAARGPGGLPALRPAARWAVMIGFAATVGLAIKEGGTSARLDGIHTVGFSAIALMGAGLLVVAGTSKSPLLCGRTLGTFAKYSYAMYLFHMPVRIVITRYGFVPETWLQQLAFYGVATAATLAAGWASWHLIEKRLLRKSTVVSSQSSG